MMEKNDAIKLLEERVSIDRSMREGVVSDFDKFCEQECIAIETVLNIINNNYTITDEYLFTIMPQGVCCKQMIVKIIKTSNNKYIFKNLLFKGGCQGNLSAIAKLLEGKDVIDVIKTIKGNKCGTKETSCMDQLASNLIKILQEKEGVSIDFEE